MPHVSNRDGPTRRSKFPFWLPSILLAMPLALFPHNRQNLIDSPRRAAASSFFSLPRTERRRHVFYKLTGGKFALFDGDLHVVVLQDLAQDLHFIPWRMRSPALILGNEWLAEKEGSSIKISWSAEAWQIKNLQDIYAIAFLSCVSVGRGLFYSRYNYVVPSLPQMYEFSE